MKRLISLLALLVSLCALAPGAFSDGEGLPVPAGDALRGYSKKEGYVYVSLGAYPTDSDGTVRPILWRVLSTDGISAYLLSEYILEAGRIHSDRNTYRSWDTSDLFMYLNGVFRDTAFSEDDQRLLINRTEDGGLVTLITASEMQSAELGFVSNNARRCLSTDYAKTTGDPKKLYIYSKGHCYSPWWSRTRSDTNKNQQRRVMDEGKTGRIDVQAGDLGVRPAVNIDLRVCLILSGAGTMEDPYVLGWNSAEDE